MKENGRAASSTKPAMEMYAKIHRWMLYVLTGRSIRGTSTKTLDVHHLM